MVIVCESFNRYDTGEHSEKFLQNGFQVFDDFDLSPSGNSGTSFVCMDSEDDWDTVAAGKNPWSAAFRNRVPAIETGRSWICNFVPTKIITPQWPGKWNITKLDPDSRAEDTCTMDSPIEPETLIFARLLNFLESEFYNSQYQRVIYWTLIGHVKNRIGQENNGLPDNLRLTFKQLASLISNEVLPRLDMKNTVVMLHPDHGTWRNRKSYEESINDGWLWIHHPEMTKGKRYNRRVSWSDYRRTIQEHFALEEYFSKNDGASVIKT
jgi:hypothetical protein